MFLKLFRHTGYESILEGEVTQTGLGFVIRKKLLKLSDLFRIMRNRVQAPDSVEPCDERRCVRRRCRTQNGRGRKRNDRSRRTRTGSAGKRTLNR